MHYENFYCTILLDPLDEVINGFVVDQDLVAITVVVDSDSCVGCINEQPFKWYSLLLTPNAVGRPAVQDDGVLLATDADVEKDVAEGIEDIDGGVVDTWASAGSQVQFCGLEDDDVLSLEWCFQGDGLGDGKEVEDHWICWVGCRSVDER